MFAWLSLHQDCTSCHPCKWPRSDPNNPVHGHDNLLILTFQILTNVPQANTNVMRIQDVLILYQDIDVSVIQDINYTTEENVKVHGFNFLLFQKYCWVHYIIGIRFAIIQWMWVNLKRREQKKRNWTLYLFCFPNQFARNLWTMHEKSMIQR